jgi:hypothetical protein
VTNLLTAREAWCALRESRKSVHILFVDFSKAFDRVDHNILLSDLRKAGIAGELLRWFETYLCNRWWQVRINETMSQPRAAKRGVPQGAVLGPLLFTLYVNSLPQLITSSCLMFADDLKLWRTVEGEREARLLQEDLNTLSSWCQARNLPINASKSGLMMIGEDQVNPGYTIAGELIPLLQTTRDLGVMVSKDLKTHAHSDLARTRGLRTTWMLRRTFQVWTPKLYRILNSTFIRPVIEYGQPAYFPCTLGESHRLEKVQSLGTRMVSGMRGLTYEQRCSTLQVFTLNYRRWRADLIFIYKTVCKRRHPELLQYFPPSQVEHTRGHKFKLEVQRTDRLPHVYRLSRRAINDWNRLPPHVIEAETVNQFKLRLDEYSGTAAYGTPLST